MKRPRGRWRAGPAGLVGCIGLAATGCGEAPPPPAGDVPNLVLVSIDSLRPDHLGCYGYGRDTSPFLDELAARGVRFSNAISTTSWTLPAHAALFTGLRDSVHGLVDNGLRLADEHLTLAELLAARGYRTAGFFGGPYLHPAFGLGQGFGRYVSCMAGAPADDAGVRAEAMQPEGPSHRDVTGPRTSAAVREWAAQGGEEPFFLFVHLWDVHYDYLAPASYVERFDPGYAGPVDGRLMANPAIHAGMDARDRAHVEALYDAEIRFTDDVLRELFDHLGRRGLLRDTLVVVTADHGEEFFEHGQKGHNKTLYDEVLRVPLIVAWPGRLDGGRVVEEQVQLVDLFPTLARLGGHTGPLAVQGRDLGPVLLGEAELADGDALAELFLDGRDVRALRSRARKVVQPARGRPAFLFDLVRDPGEQAVIRPGDAEHEARRLAAQAELEAAVGRNAAFAEALGARGARPLELSGELAERLAALGYLGDDGD